MDVAMAACVGGKMLNAGQSCIGAKRYIIVESRYQCVAIFSFSQHPALFLSFRSVVLPQRA